MIPIRHFKLNTSLTAKSAFVVTIILLLLYQFQDFDLPSYSSFLSHRPDEVPLEDAPWKNEIGRWLSACHSKTTFINISETIGDKSCRDNCSNGGVCNRENGECRCFLGYTGEECSQKRNLSCNFPSTENLPYGRWVMSMCSTHCDTTRAMCFCGEQSKYPQRHVFESCGFKIKSGIPEFSIADEDIFTTNGSKNGWCNVDPAEAYAKKVNYKEQCRCIYDGFEGRFCEIPVESFCINQCSGHGHCRGGFCQCDNGWYGSDCSIPSVEPSLSEWPEWLLPAHIELPDEDSGERKRAFSQKKRPLIYVYDLPPDFNSRLLEGRLFKYHCAHRLYNHWNETVWINQPYAAQMALYESILASPHRTTNGDEADYFFVPVLDSCIIARAYETPYLRKNEPEGMRSHLALKFYKEAYLHISETYPYWNRSSGQDHIWFFSWDEGACFAPKEIWSSMMVVHWGNTNTKHKHSTTAYPNDNWNGIPEEERGNHSCFDPAKDHVIPAWKVPDGITMAKKLWKRPLKSRKTLFYFNGNLGPTYEKGRIDANYSMGIREKVAQEFGSKPNKKGELGRQHEEDVIVVSQRSANYFEELADSVFCGVFPGHGWSGRMEDSILQGCIPVVIQDGILLPYENIFDYSRFVVRLAEDEIPNLIKILRGFNKSEVELMKSNVEKLWQRFVYRDNTMLEAKRQKDKLHKTAEWAHQFALLTKNDVFGTFIQILHYKLHNDPWRLHFRNRQKKVFGLPQECMRFRD